MRVGVIGLGYVGLNFAIAASRAGNEIIGVDRNSALVEALKAGRSHIEGILDSDVAKSGVRFEVSPSSLSEIGAVVIAVPTPLDNNRVPDLSFVKDAAAVINAHVPKGALVINESTSYPGTLRQVIAPIVGSDYLFAAAPERIDPGNQSWGASNTPRLIAGLTAEATKRARELYESFCGSVIEVSSPEVAEAAKLFENTFRQVNIALVNEFAQVASALGIPTYEVLEAASTKPFGFMKFLPSLGVGGHCIPVDPSYLSFAAEEVGQEAKFIDLANQINLDMPAYVARRISNEIGGVAGKKIQVAGISYKADISDIRESPALALIAQLRTLGADVTWHDPLVKEWSGEASAPLGSCDAGIIAAAHGAIDFSPWRGSSQKVFDVSTSTHLEWPKFL